MLRETMGHLFRWLPRLQPLGAEMWPLDPATILFRWENGQSLPRGPLVVVYWEASPLSVGLSTRTQPDQIWRTEGMHYEQATSIVTFSDPVEAQVHRESAGAPISFRILSSLMSLLGGTSSSSTIASRSGKDRTLLDCRQTQKQWPLACSKQEPRPGSCIFLGQKSSL